jgi:hypothetical protein
MLIEIEEIEYLTISKLYKMDKKQRRSQEWGRTRRLDPDPDPIGSRSKIFVLSGPDPGSRPKLLDWMNFN